MATSIRVWDTWATATRATFSNLGTALVAAGAAALLSAPLDAWIAANLSGTPPAQEDLLKVALSWSGFALVTELLFGPIFAAMAVYVAWTHARKAPSSIYGALNFALNRYKRMFLPHMGAQLSVQIGMLVVVPGVLYMCMYAFVDPVACLEDEPWPMSRSKRLTQGRRKTILWVALPLILLSMLRIFTDLMALGHGLGVFILDYLAIYLLQFWLWVGFTHMYLQRTQAPRQIAPETKG